MTMPDTSGVADYTPIKPGWYPARVEATEEKTSKAGNPYAEVEFILGDGRHVWGRLSYKDDALWKLKQFKLACGGKDEDSLISLYINGEIEIYIDNEDWEGEDGKTRTSNRVNEYRVINAPTPKSDKDDFPFD